MIKRDLVIATQKALAENKCTVSLAVVEKMLDALGDVAAAELLGGGEITLPSLGKLKIRKTAARTGRNPRTGESLPIPAGKKVVFVPSKELKEALHG